MGFLEIVLLGGAAWALLVVGFVGLCMTAKQAEAMAASHAEAGRTHCPGMKGVAARSHPLLLPSQRRLVSRRPTLG